MKAASGPLRRLCDGNTNFEHPSLLLLRYDLEAEAVELVSHQAPNSILERTFDLQRGTCSSRKDQQS